MSSGNQEIVRTQKCLQSKAGRRTADRAWETWKHTPESSRLLAHALNPVAGGALGKRRECHWVQGERKHQHPHANSFEVADETALVIVEEGWLRKGDCVTFQIPKLTSLG